MYLSVGVVRGMVGEGGRMEAEPEEDRNETEPREGKGSCQKSVGQRGFE